MQPGGGGETEEVGRDNEVGVPEEAANDIEKPGTGTDNVSRAAVSRSSARGHAEQDPTSQEAEDHGEAEAAGAAIRDRRPWASGCDSGEASQAGQERWQQRGGAGPPEGPCDPRSPLESRADGGKQTDFTAGSVTNVLQEVDEAEVENGACRSQKSPRPYAI